MLCRYLFTHTFISTHTHTNSSTKSPHHHQRRMHFNYYIKHHLKIVYHVNSNTASLIFQGYETSLVAQMVKHLLTMRETRVWYLGWEDPLEKEMATYSSTLAWKIPWMEEPGRLQSMGWLRVGHDWATSLSLFTFMHWRRKWQPTPVFLPGESHGWRSLVGYSPWGHKESDTTERLHLHFEWKFRPLLAK